jgi:hypothetical protein
MPPFFGTSGLDCRHLREPRPNLVTRPSNGDGVVQAADWFLDQLIAG